jgi:predicted RNA binding protein YcfA (HicA-like mRNA interferase family)
MASEERFAVVRKMLESAGWDLDRINGAHHIFTKPGLAPMVIPVHHGKVKPFYVRQAKQAAQGD